MIFQLEQNEDIVEELIQANLYSQLTDPIKKMKIRRYRYILENGAFEIITSIEGNNLHIQFTIDDNMYEEHIPIKYKDSTHEVYPYGDVLFTNIELLSVSFHNDFPWAEEVFVATYTGDPETKNIDIPKEDIRFLQTYYVPRDITGSAPSECNGNEYLVIGGSMLNVHNFPWKFGPIYVPYVDISKTEMRTDFQLPDRSEDNVNTF